MRALILIAAAALTLAACKNNDQVDNSQNVDENLTAENIVSNDVTAIDAVTGDASNMAAESAVNDLGNVSNDTGNTAAFPKPKPQTVSAATTKSPPPAKTAPPASNSVSNAATNGE
jgi:hypothetical protein